jgi:integrase/recombinase XerD
MAQDNQSERITILGAIDLFLLDAQARRLTVRTVGWYQYHLADFARWLEQSQVMDLDTVTSIHIKMYLVDLQKRGWASTTQHNAASAIRSFFNVCITEELLTASPMRRVKMPKVEKKILPALTQEDVRELLKACQVQRDRVLVLF